MTVHEMLRAMPSRELAEWQAFFRLREADRQQAGLERDADAGMANLKTRLKQRRGK